MQLTFLILLVLIPSITTLQCYVCNSNEDSTCAQDGNLDGFKQRCPQTIDPYCRKIVQTVNKETSIVRACGSKIGAKSCYKTAGANSANVCSCNDDLCNNAHNQKQQMMTIFSSIVVLAITMIILR